MAYIQILDSLYYMVNIQGGPKKVSHTTKLNYKNVLNPTEVCQFDYIYLPNFPFLHNYGIFN